jgi:tight adherence protein C
VVRVTATGAWAAALGILLGLGGWTLVSLAPRFRAPRLAARVAPYLQDVSPAARQYLAIREVNPLPVFGAVLSPVTIRARQVLTLLLGGDEQVGRRLRQSGSALTVEAFRSQQLVWVGIGAGVGVAVSIAVARLQAIVPIAPVLIVLLSAALAAIGRDWLLRRAARRRLARLLDELPAVLEFMTLSLSAGEGILDALRRISRSSSGELAAELGSVVTAVNTGLPLADTLVELSRSLDLPPLSRCVDQLISALERGTPLAEVLRAQAQDARDDAKRVLLELAGKKEVAMLIPLVFLILPVTILFAVYPGLVVLQLGF